ncbi:MAG: T9SS type A sorting domain-containing protein [Candidatus Latescibacteria bacterium]|nr:T9SS type A sorting domain-containing protein [Candidatus Latescibacterota bacterium]
MDIYVNGEMFKDDFGFREATPYLDVPANVELAIGVAPGTSTGPGDILATIPVTLTADKTYVAVANGVLDPSKFSANPDGRSTAFTLFLKEGAREAAEDPEMVEFFSLHGVTDAPMVDVYVFFGKLVVDDAKYGDMTGYQSLEPEKQNAIVLGNYSGLGDWHFDYLGLYDIDLRGLAGGSAVVFASGFMSPYYKACDNDKLVDCEDKIEGREFGLFAALPDGSVVEFPRRVCSRAEAEEMLAEAMNPSKQQEMGMPEPEKREFTLGQNYPNPFNPVTSISFTLPSAQYVSLKVYDASGRLVGTLVDGHRSAGTHRASFEALNIASGTYFYKITAGEFTATRKMILLR